MGADGLVVSGGGEDEVGLLSVGECGGKGEFVGWVSRQVLAAGGEGGVKEEFGEADFYSGGLGLVRKDGREEEEEWGTYEDPKYASPSGSDCIAGSTACPASQAGSGSCSRD